MKHWKKQHRFNQLEKIVDQFYEDINEYLHEYEYLQLESDVFPGGRFLHYTSPRDNTKLVNIVNFDKREKEIL